MNPFKSIANDKIEIKKPDGRRFNCSDSSVQNDKIFIYCGEIPLEEGDTIIHKIDENRNQEFIVIDRGYHNKFFGEHYQAKVKRKDKTNITSPSSTEIVENTDDENNYDVFISYSSKDKEFVNELYQKLKEKGLKIWYDEIKMLIGDDLHKKINDGLNNSEFVVVVLSENYVKSFWPTKEYKSSYDLMNEEKLLPINHGLSRNQLKEYDKTLLNVIYMDTGKNSVEEIAENIYMKIKK